MAASDLQIDLTRNNPNNKFTNEVRVVDVTKDRSVWPINYPFYFNDGEFFVEGRKGSGSWGELIESIDFIYSPVFVEYALATGVEIASYIVLINDKFDQVRFTYRALGQFTDNVLAAEILNLTAQGKLDRSKVSNWSRVKGSAPNYSPYAKDPNVIDRTAEEVLYLQTQLILDALRNPSSSTAVLPKDITAVYLELSQKVTEERVKELISQGLTSTVTAAANVNAQVHRFPSDVTGIKGTLHITSTTGRINMLEIKAYRVDATGAWVFTKDPGANRDGNVEPTLSMSLSGSEYVIVCQCPAAVTYKFKEEARFTGV